MNNWTGNGGDIRHKPDFPGARPESAHPAYKCRRDGYLVNFLPIEGEFSGKQAQVFWGRGSC